MKYAIRSPGTLAFRVKIASHGILSGAAAPADHLFPLVEFLSAKECSDEQVESMSGFSPQLLSIIQDINRTLKLPRDAWKDAADRLLSRLDCLQQICLLSDSCAESNQQMACENINTTAETYRLAAILLVHYRILGYAIPMLASAITDY